MAFSLDNTASGTLNNLGLNLTISMAVAASANLLVAVVNTTNTFANGPGTGVPQWNGVDMVAFTGTIADTNSNTVQVFYLKNPSTGTHNFVASFHTPGIPAVTVALLSFIGSDPTTPFDPYNGGYNSNVYSGGISNPSANFITGRTGEILIGSVRASGSSSPSFTDNGGQTSIINGHDAFGVNGTDDIAYKTGTTPGTYNIGWSATNAVIAVVVIVSVQGPFVNTTDNLFETQI